MTNAVATSTCQKHDGLRGILLRIHSNYRIANFISNYSRYGYLYG